MSVRIPRGSAGSEKWLSRFRDVRTLLWEGLGALLSITRLHGDMSTRTYASTYEAKARLCQGLDKLEIEFIVSVPRAASELN